MSFYRCSVCGKIITMLDDRSTPTVCCGKSMEELVSGTSDGATEKHVPKVTVEGSLVTIEVGEIPHPMLEEHHIEWIVLETKEGHQVKWLSPGKEPKAVFALSESDQFVAAYEYCNLHGLWTK